MLVFKSKKNLVFVVVGNYQGIYTRTRTHYFEVQYTRTFLVHAI